MRTVRKTGSRSRLLQAAQYGFMAAGILALMYCALVMGKARLYQWIESRRFSAALESRSTASPAIVISPHQDGAVLGRLSVPRLGISVMLVEGVEDGDLRRGVGHIPGTALPGETGNLGIAGHRDTYFRPLRLIRQGDTITLDTLPAVYDYRVVWTKVVEPEEVQVLYPAEQDALTLVTCFPFDYVGSAPQRFIVRAERLPRSAKGREHQRSSRQWGEQRHPRSSQLAG